MAITFPTQPFNLTQKFGATVLSAKELYNYFEVTEDFQCWGYRMLRDYFEMVDYIAEYVENEELPFNVEVIDYFLYIECAKRVSLANKSKQGRLAYAFLLQLQQNEKKGKEKNLSDVVKLAIKEAQKASEEALSALMDDDLPW